MVGQLDPENAQEFQGVARHARERLRQKMADNAMEEAKAEMKAQMDEQLGERIKQATEKLESKLADMEKKAAGGGGVVVPRGPDAAPRAEAKQGPRRANVTPKEFKQLLPGRGAITGEFFGKHDLEKKFYKFEYY